MTTTKDKLVIQIQKALDRGELLDVTHLKPNAAGSRRIPQNTSKSSRRGVNVAGFPIVSADYEHFALAMSILGPEYMVYADLWADQNRDLAGKVKIEDFRNIQEILKNNNLVGSMTYMPPTQAPTSIEYFGGPMRIDGLDRIDIKPVFGRISPGRSGSLANGRLSTGSVANSQGFTQRQSKREEAIREAVSARSVADQFLSSIRPGGFIPAAMPLNILPQTTVQPVTNIPGLSPQQSRRQDTFVPLTPQTFVPLGGIKQVATQGPLATQGQGPLATQSFIPNQTFNPLSRQSPLATQGQGPLALQSPLATQGPLSRQSFIPQNQGSQSPFKPTTQIPGLSPRSSPNQGGQSFTTNQSYTTQGDMSNFDIRTLSGYIPPNVQTSRIGQNGSRTSQTGRASRTSQTRQNGSRTSRTGTSFIGTQPIPNFDIKTISGYIPSDATSMTDVTNDYGRTGQTFKSNLKPLRTPIQYIEGENSDQRFQIAEQNKDRNTMINVNTDEIFTSPMTTRRSVTFQNDLGNVLKYQYQEVYDK